MADYSISNQGNYLLMNRDAGYEVVLSKMPTMMANIASACKEAGVRKVLVRGPRTRVKLATMDILRTGSA